MQRHFGAPAHLKKLTAPKRHGHTPAASGAQSRCDAIQAEFRAKGERPSIRRQPPPRPAPLIPTDDPLKLRLAEELDYARRMLDQMGDALSADPTVLMRHGVSLQSVDIVGQIMGHIANVIRSRDLPAAVDRIGMAELKSRLTRRSLV